ncbi:uncharacterized protein P174DRAFT_77365 [Aspergillus novofumigatus IBT 16806]|uniref:Uncharacterized protein n=1 Tax=Aspergillus novofumigatus (strain IBT 16806) TaxID=1392255 RepID=A0A2I1CFI5_ASPN1|nr:uncharacterized protein P174DRAFT_77365 [Aspergillus novofumigatus IBT 16806]PKX96389.1 hypothetical protein P174DRAFT_77365 [Aspergillus novofumigatus IBT 16806]
MPKFERGWKSLALMVERSCRLRHQYSTIARHKMSRITGHSVVTQPTRRCLRHPTRESSSSSGFREYLQPFFLIICAVGQMCQGPQPHARLVSGLQQADKQRALCQDSLFSVSTEADAAPQQNDALFCRYGRVLLGVLIPSLSPCPCPCPCPNNTACFKGPTSIYSRGLTDPGSSIINFSLKMQLSQQTSLLFLPLGKYRSKFSPSELMPIVQQIMYQKLRPMPQCLPTFTV